MLLGQDSERPRRRGSSRVTAGALAGARPSRHSRLLGVDGPIAEVVTVSMSDGPSTMSRWPPRPLRPRVGEQRGGAHRVSNACRARAQFLTRKLAGSLGFPSVTKSRAAEAFGFIPADGAYPGRTAGRPP